MIVRDTGKTQGKITLGDRLSPGTKRILREKCSAVLEVCPADELYVDSLYSFFAESTGYERLRAANTRYLFVILDHNELFLYRFCAARDQACLLCVIKHIFDNFGIARRQVLKEYYAENEFEFFYDPAYLELLPHLLARMKRGFILRYNLVSLEISFEPALVHPLCACGCNSAQAANGEGLAIQSRVVSRSLRAEAPADFSDLVSDYSGIIRAHNAKLDRNSLPTAISKVNYQSSANIVDHCGGKAFDKRRALLISECEALERYHLRYMSLNESFICDSYRNLNGRAQDPAQLFYTRPRTREGQIAYSPELKFNWVWADNLTQRTQALIPAQEVWYNTDLLPNENRCIQSTSNGCALGSSYEEALLFGLLEIIERDSFLVTWYLRRDCDRIDAESVDDEAFRLLLEKMRRAHPVFDFHFLNITTEVAVPAVWVFGVRKSGDGMKTLSTAAARITAERAMFSALKELAGLLEFDREFDRKRSRFMELWRDPQKIEQMEDHYGVYGLEPAFENFAFLDLQVRPAIRAEAVNRRSIFEALAQYDLRDLITSIISQMKRIGCEVLAKDLTRPEFAGKEIRCVKAFVTNFYPIYFGYYEMRFDITPRLKKLARRFGKEDIHTLNDINLTVHPFP